MTRVDPIVEAFHRLAARLEKPEHWTKGAYARPSRRSKKALFSYDPAARCWCLIGAIHSVAQFEAATKLEAILMRQLNDALLTNWNDAPGRTHRQVRDLVAAGLAAYLGEVGNG